MQPEKNMLRKFIAIRKSSFPKDNFLSLSLNIKKQIELLPIFRQAQTILLYHSLPDEVQTPPMLANWANQKQCLLPQVHGADLVIREYLSGDSLQAGYMGIQEPAVNIFRDLDKIDLIIVPGIAFDAEKNRLGRGKGYYDKLLSKTKAVKIGICYDFQLVEKVPVCAHDIPVDYVITPTRLYL